MKNESIISARFLYVYRRQNHLQRKEYDPLYGEAFFMFIFLMEVDNRFF